jgi:hypothetical protein
MQLQPQCNAVISIFKNVKQGFRKIFKSYTNMLVYKSTFTLSVLLFSNVVFAQNVLVTASHATTSGSYATLKGAFDAINAGTHQGAIVLNIVNNTTETATAQLNSYSGPAVFTSILIQPSGGGARTITGNFSSPLISFNSSDYVTIDGLNTGGNSLQISNPNTSSTASTINFYADATFNKIRNTTILGSSKGNLTGTIVFGTGTIGNSYNAFKNNNIGNVGANLPYNAIYASYTAGTASVNTSDTLDANNIYNYFSQNGNSSGVFLDATATKTGSTSWVITNNNFYQTGARNNALAATTSRAIFIGSSATNISGSGYTITGNVIGYAASNASGVTNYGPGGDNNYRFVGMEINAGVGAISSIQNNTVAGISINSTYTGTLNVFAGIQINTGLVNVGNITGNKIGLLTGGINITTAGVQANSFGIYSSQNSTTSLINNNAIINCSVTSSTAASTTIKFSAIYATGSSTYTIAANTIGRAMSATEYVFNGIEANLSTLVLNSIQGNTVEGVNIVSNTYNGTAAVFTGINVIAGLVNIGNTTGNIIGTLTNSIYISTSGASTKSYGIFSSQVGGGPLVNNNVIQNCTAVSSAAANANIKFTGIYVTGAAGYTVSTNTVGRSITATEYLCYGIEANVGTSVTSNIQNNIVAGVSVTSTYSGTTSLFSGIHISAGVVNVGSSSTTGNQIGTSVNSIFVTTTGSVTNSFGIYSNQSTSSSATIANNTILNCTFYSSIAANATTKFAAIYVTGSSSYSVRSNTITTAISTSEYLFYGIEANLGTTVTSNINGNSIAGVTMVSSYNGATAIFAGIYVRAGIVNIGDATGNIIGTSANSIFITTTGASALSYGIFSDQTAAAPTINKNVIQNILLQSNVAASAAIKFSGIYITGGSGNFITTNTIGARINATNYIVNGIELNMAGTIPNSIQANIIAGIDITTNLTGIVGTEASPFIGINIVNGNANIGSTTGNNIGTSADYIRINTTGNRTHNYGIKIGITVASVDISKNNMENISMISTAPITVDWINSFVGIYTNNTGAYNINDNTIGSLTTNNIVLGTTNTNVPYLFRGIVCEGAYGVTAARNTICNITNATNYEGVGADMATIGILVNSPYTHNFNTNKIYALIASTTLTANVGVAGIVTATTVAGGNMYNNKIYGLINTARGTTNSISGFIPNGGNWTFYNNMISLSNGANTNGVICNGICDLGAAGARNYYFNSIHIEGTSTGSHNSVAFQFDRVTGTVNSRNNIFDMRRTSIGKNYAIINTTGNFSGFISDYNIINSPSMPVVCFATTDKTFVDWKTASSNDAKSIYNEPIPFVDQSIADLHIVGAPCKLVGQGIAISILTDFDIDSRKTGIRPFGPEIGADEITKNITWAGTTNRDWNNASNWVGNKIPNTITENVVIPNVVNKPIINMGEVFQVSSITIASGSSLTNNGTLKIYQTITSSNSLNTQNGTIDLNSKCDLQLISGSMFTNKSIKHLIISNASNVDPAVAISAVLNDTLKVTNSLSFGNVNDAIVETGDNLTLVSNATETANLLDPNNGGANYGNLILGKAVIERYLFAQKSWRFIATPVDAASSPTITSAWREAGITTSTGYGTQMTGPASYIGMDQTSQRGSIKYYNAADDVWTEVTNTGNILANPLGYMVFVRGDRSVSQLGLGATNLRIKGDILQGNQVFSVPAGKFQSFGNPYACRINFTTVLKNNLVNSFTIWNPRATGLYNVGGYETYALAAGGYWLNGVVGGTLRNYIESGEAVFVQSNGSAGTITVRETDKTTSSLNVSRGAVASKSSIIIPTLDISLYEKNNTDSSTLLDAVSVNFDDNFSSSIDNEDVRKLTNPNNSLTIYSHTKKLAVEKRPMPTTADSIFLNIAGITSTKYEFEIYPTLLSNVGVEAFIYDKFLQVNIPISTSEITYVNFDITASNASKATDRFVIVFKQSTTTSFTTMAATRSMDKSILVNWGVATEKNINNYVVEQSNDGINFTAIATKLPTANNGTNPEYSAIDAAAGKENNWYRVKMSNANGTIKYSSIAMVAALKDEVENVKSSISIYPNTVVNGNVNLYFDDSKNGTYNVCIYNSAGQKVSTNILKLQHNNMHSVIEISSLTNGHYEAIITNDIGEKITIPFLVQ